MATSPVTHLAEIRQPEYGPEEMYINRETSLVEFNKRVLAQSRDENTPLLERLRFLCISCSNLDEFFEIRFSGLLQQHRYAPHQVGQDGLLPGQALDSIRDKAHNLVHSQYELLNNVLLPALEKEDIYFDKRNEWTSSQDEWIREYFETQLVPILSPVHLDPAHPFPRVLNKGLHFIVYLKGKDAFGRPGGIAVVQAPRSLPRIIQIPDEYCKGGSHFVFLSSIIHASVSELFPGMEIKGCHQFRVTRNSDLFVDDEEIEDLRMALEGELPSRRYGEAVRLEVVSDCPDEAVEFLSKQFCVQETEVYKVDGPVNLHRLSALPNMLNRPDLLYHGFTQGVPQKLLNRKNIFDTISQSDILLNHPYQSFNPVVELLKDAAKDPKVLAIKQTLYRTGANSSIVDALVEAASAGKEVTVVVELRARFDEAANISLASRLQEAGALVVYGVVGYKTHAKMLLIVRREKDKLKRYVHLGTGNYHARTARLYTDYGLMTADHTFGKDVHHIFIQLTGLGQSIKMKKVLTSPFKLHKEVLKKIEREAANAKEGKPARIIAKMNSLVEGKVIEALYSASQAGVQIDLIVRGICCLRPGVAGISENIRVRSIVARFLEHSRVTYFENDGDPEVYLSSADWMDRNLYRRVETFFPILDAKLKQRVIDEGLMIYLEDNCKSWLLQPNGCYSQVPFYKEKPLNAQEYLLQNLTN